MTPSHAVTDAREIPADVSCLRTRLVGLPSLPAAAAMSHPMSTNLPSSTSHVHSIAPPLFISWPPPTSISRPVNRAYTRRRIATSPCNSSTPGSSGLTPNESDIPSSGGQPNLPDDNGKDEVDPCRQSPQSPYMRHFQLVRPARNDLYDYSRRVLYVRC